MKITIDTQIKEISFESSENIKDILDFLQQHFPDEWMSFTLKGYNTVSITIPFSTHVIDETQFWEQVFNVANLN